MKETKNEMAEFSKMIRAFEINCSVPEITKDQLMLYFNAFKSYPLNTVKEAFSKVLYEWKYNKMPTIGVFIKFIQGNQPEIEDQAEIQAAEVLKQMHICGSYGTPEFNDPITRELMKHRFNLPNMCRSMKEGEEKWFVKEFVQAYKAFGRNKENLLIDPPPELKKIANNLFERIE